MRFLCSFANVGDFNSALLQHYLRQTNDVTNKSSDYCAHYFADAKNYATAVSDYICTPVALSHHQQQQHYYVAVSATTIRMSTAAAAEQAAAPTLALTTIIIAFLAPKKTLELCTKKYFEGSGKYIYNGYL